MSDMFLSADEIHNMTERVQRRAQVKMLRSMGIEFRERADGSLAVLRRHVEKVFGAPLESAKKTKDYQPNWDGLNA
ncbi:DUF4224 domain-containing protein [Massilia sp. DD77]|uniref:DUF4224 domain-containing protein n=1 Tax=Massilia sp. DD77 TaxID=3109349 RepID=UPI002FFDD6C1